MLADQLARDIECRSSGSDPLVHEAEALFDEIGFGMPRRLLELVELRPLFASEPRVHILLHRRKV